jgi:very-short-patch-repair endonuclease
MMRREATPAEKKLWAALRKEQLGGLHFRRQHAVDRFVLDFYCPTLKLCVEVDGEVHLSQAERDEARSEVLSARGIKVIRFTNEQVLHDLPAVLSQISER